MGFTLIEILVALAILAILLLMAIPSASDSVVRKQIEEALPLANVAKTPINGLWATAQELAPDNAAVGLPVPEKIVNDRIQSVSIENGAIHITFGYRAHSAIKDKTLSLRPAIVEDAKIVPITWVCGNTKAPDPMTIKGNNKTDIPPRYLPFACRAPADNK
ncbi:MAG: pilin [Burkholderiales bacterium]|nr:pilin [Burkholderiales bacterium]